MIGCPSRGRMKIDGRVSEKSEGEGCRCAGEVLKVLVLGNEKAVEIAFRHERAGTGESPVHLGPAEHCVLEIGFGCGHGKGCWRFLADITQLGVGQLAALVMAVNVGEGVHVLDPVAAMGRRVAGRIVPHWCSYPGSAPPCRGWHRRTAERKCVLCPAGSTTLWGVDTNRSLVQRCIMSPTLTTKVPSIGGASTHSWARF